MITNIWVKTMTKQENTRKKLMDLMEKSYLIIEKMGGLTNDELREELFRRETIESLKNPEFEARRQLSYEIEEYSASDFYFEGKSYKNKKGKEHGIFCIIASWHFATKEPWEAIRGYYECPVPEEFYGCRENGIYDFQGSFEEGRKLLLDEGLKEQTGVLELFGASEL